MHKIKCVAVIVAVALVCGEGFAADKSRVTDKTKAQKLGVEGNQKPKADDKNSKVSKEGNHHEGEEFDASRC